MVFKKLEGSHERTDGMANNPSMVSVQSNGCKPRSSKNGIWPPLRSARVDSVSTTTPGFLSSGFELCESSTLASLCARRNHSLSNSLAYRAAMWLSSTAAVLRTDMKRSMREAVWTCLPEDMAPHAWAL